jgi:hypothetical protein
MNKGRKMRKKQREHQCKRINSKRMIEGFQVDINDS